MATGVNFNNVLLKAFLHADPKSTKNTDSLAVFFMLLGSLQVKSAHKMLAKSTLGVNFINILREHFWYKNLFKAKL